MFKFLFGNTSPTRAWQPYSGQLLTFDLDAGALNGVELGSRLECLSVLGPDEDRKLAQCGEFCYYSLGLCVDCDGVDNVIQAYEIVFRDPDEPKFRCFAGRVIRHGQTFDLAAMTLDQCAEALGEYFWKDCDEDESIVFYEFPGREWQLEFDTASSLQRITITSRPLLADEAQRKAYHVMKGWPPH